jgi:hypothetical protein
MFHNISPHSGQSTVLTFDPGIQNTGYNPRPEGSLARISIFP